MHFFCRCLNRPECLSSALCHSKSVVFFQFLSCLIHCVSSHIMCVHPGAVCADHSSNHMYVGMPGIKVLPNIIRLVFTADPLHEIARDHLQFFFVKQIIGMKVQGHVNDLGLRSFVQRS